MKTLNEIYQNHKGPLGFGDKGSAHSYIEVYEEILKPYRENGDILELGIRDGDSLRMWREYFKNGLVAGVDIGKYDRMEDLVGKEGYKIIISDATSPDLPFKLDGKLFDVIIDDASHKLEDQIASFNLLKQYVKPNGVYLIEDIQHIDLQIELFKNLHDNIKVFDQRNVKNRYDDIIIMYKF